MRRVSYIPIVAHFANISSQNELTSVYTRSILKCEGYIAIIAEIKLASPTNPSLGSESDIIQRAIAYEKVGADAISFITEKHYFKGSTIFISQLKTRVNITILQKDFVIDPYQIYEAKMIGSDAILLIARLVDKDVLKDFVTISQE